MSVLREKPQVLYEQSVRTQFMEKLPKSPGWLATARERGFFRFEELGFPTLAQEAWRYIDLRPLLNTWYQEYLEVPAIELPLRYFMPEAEQSRLVFIDGHYSSALSTIENLPQGVIVSDMQTAVFKHADLLSGYLAQALPEEPDAFAALNTALFEHGVFIYVPEQTKLAQPVQILYLQSDDGEQPKAAYPRMLFVAGEWARLQVAVQFLSLNKPERPASPTHLKNSVIELHAARNADITLSLIQQEDSATMHLATTHASLEEKAVIRMNTFGLGGWLVRNNINASLMGEESHFVLNGLAVLACKAQVHNHVVVDHLKPKCVSEQVYKGIVDDEAKLEFDGTIIVRPDAQQTDAVQLNKNLLLSDDARVFTRPQLRIDADDVKCSHGATVGQLSEDEIFYLQSRGLTRELAQGLLTFGFAEEIILKVEQPGLRDYLEDTIMGIMSEGAHTPDQSISQAISHVVSANHTEKH